MTNAPVDIDNASAEPTLPLAQYTEDWLIYQNIPVKIEFTENAEPLKEKLLKYFIDLRNR